MTHFGWICGISRAPLMSLGGQPDASAVRERFLAAPGEPPVACEAHVAVMLILYMRRVKSVVGPDVRRPDPPESRGNIDARSRFSGNCVRHATTKGTPRGSMPHSSGAA